MLIFFAQQISCRIKKYTINYYKIIIEYNSPHSSVVERLPCKQKAGGSNPPGGYFVVFYSYPENL